MALSACWWWLLCDRRKKNMMFEYGLLTSKTKKEESLCDAKQFKFKYATSHNDKYSIDILIDFVAFFFHNWFPQMGIMLNNVWHPYIRSINFNEEKNLINEMEFNFNNWKYFAISINDVINIFFTRQYSGNYATFLKSRCVSQG